MAKRPGEPQRVPVFNLGAIGVNRDLPPHTLPPEAWTDSKNIRFIDKNAARFLGHSETFGTPTVAPGFVFNVPSATASLWTYFSKTKAYVYDTGVHSNITRQSVGVDVDYTATNFRDWNACLLGGVPIFNNGQDVPQYWPTLSAATRLANLTNWPSNARAKVIRAFGPYLIALNITEGGVAKPHMVWWSHYAATGSIPSSWDYTDATKDAGQRELTDIHGGEIQDGLLLGNQLMLYKSTSTHILRKIAGNDIFSLELMLSSAGVLATRCVTSFKNGSRHFAVTEDDIIIHSGNKDAESILDGKLRQYLFSDIDSTYFANSFTFELISRREVWFVYPTSGSEFPNKALVWNYYYNTLQFRDFSGLAFDSGNLTTVDTETWTSTSGTWDTETSAWGSESRKKPIIADPDNEKFYLLDDSYTFGGSTPLAYIERTGLAITGRDRQGQPKVDFDSRKLCSRIWPKITGSSPVTVTIGAQETLEASVTWQPSQTFRPGVDQYLDFEANGRLLAVRFETLTDLPWQLEGYDLLISVLGEH